jgi:hypothetical protein
MLKRHDKYSEVTTVTNRKKDGTYRHDRDDQALLLFYLNHPIQFIQIIGVVVVLEDYFEKFWLFTIDDSSGATIDVKCRKPEKTSPVTTTTTTAPPNSKFTRPLKKQEMPVHHSTADTHKSSAHLEEEEEIEAQALQTALSTMTIGTVVQAKGTITTFRSERQLSLIRLKILPTTSHELALISSRTQFLESTLSHPWVLSRREQKQLQQEAHGEHEAQNVRERRRKRRQVKMREREERHTKQIRDEYEDDELARSTAAEEAKLDGEKVNARRAV